MNRKASAVWQGSGKDGKGQLTTQSGVLSSNPYGFNTRFENEPGTNPEELIAAAHAGCFTMALAFQLQGAGFTADELRTEAVVSLEKDGVERDLQLELAAQPAAHACCEEAACPGGSRAGRPAVETARDRR